MDLLKFKETVQVLPGLLLPLKKTRIPSNLLSNKLVIVVYDTFRFIVIVARVYDQLYREGTNALNGSTLSNIFFVLLFKPSSFSTVILTFPDDIYSLI